MQQGTGNMPRASVLGSSGSLGMQSFELGGGDGRQRSWHHGTDVFPGECDGQNIRVHTVGWAAAAASAGSLARKRVKESAAAGVAARRVSRMAVQAGTAARKAAEVKAAAAIVPHEPRRSLEAGAAAARAPNQDELSGSSSERSGSAPPRPEAAAAAAGSSVRFASFAELLLPHSAATVHACGTYGRAICMFASRLGRVGRGAAWKRARRRQRDLRPISHAAAVPAAAVCVSTSLRVQQLCQRRQLRVRQPLHRVQLRRRWPPAPRCAAPRCYCHTAQQPVIPRRRRPAPRCALLRQAAASTQRSSCAPVALMDVLSVCLLADCGCDLWLWAATAGCEAAM